MPYHIALLARACEIAGQIEEAPAKFDEALQIVERTGERWFAAELRKHKGRLLLPQGHSKAAEELYRKALSIAQEQGGQAVGIARRREPRPGSAVTKGAMPEPATSLHRSTLGSPQALTPPISKRPKRSLRRSTPSRLRV
jgi:tetratricopeptide (TPR) repeat protein